MENNEKKTQFNPDYCIHPRQHILEMMEARDMSPLYLGYKIAKKTTSLQAITKISEFLWPGYYDHLKDVPMDEEMAVIFSDLFEIKPYIFMNLWNTYAKLKAEGNKETI